jgi:hypothetical protein
VGCLAHLADKLREATEGADDGAFESVRKLRASVSSSMFMLLCIPL